MDLRVQSVNVISMLQFQYENCFSPLDLFAKLRKVTFVFVISVCSHGTTLFPLEGFS